jgi:hypothetical protein
MARSGFCWSPWIRSLLTTLDWRYSKHASVLSQRFLDMVVPVLPGVRAGVFEIVVLNTDGGQVIVEGAIVPDQFVVDAAIE